MFEFGALLGQSVPNQECFGPILLVCLGAMERPLVLGLNDERMQMKLKFKNGK